MYCSNCGNALKKGLNYCNSCGGKIAASAEEKSLNNSLATALGYLGVGGIVGFILLIKVLLDKGIDEGLLAVIAISYLAAIFGVCLLLIKQISGDKQKSENMVYPINNEEPKQFTQNQTNRLNEPTQPPASVSVDTTKVLDKIPIERK